MDDGSPDRCPDMCDAWAEKDSRVSVIHKANGGLSDARNAGLAVADGEYICFVDSDDYIRSTMVADLVKAVLAAGTKMAVTNFLTVDEAGKRQFDGPIADGVFSAGELLPRFYGPLGWYYIVAWNKLYHRSMFDGIQFPIGKIHEDEFVAAQLMCRAGQIACISSENYVYIYQRKGSIMSTKRAGAHCDWLEALYLRFQFAREQELGVFAGETRAVYFRELNNLFLEPALRMGSTWEQRRKAMAQYSAMDGKTKTERINWFLFRINPRLDHWVVQKVRSIQNE